ncbi:MAG: HEPN domain-containing protein [Verrucomicrobia bacterium]|nr:HEPN domain-containing protein [Verrucomicrobiota bacterium]MBU1736153.1 HEPN domain-containing protein [Verrucomicrobiota bacterium]MBU1856753.1 HEPN domain-containing protein [Verrucomicrobiota bacterium]
MPSDSQKTAILRSWVGKADDDFKMANHAFTMGADCPFTSLCFHVQQCVEKYIKTLLALHEVDFPMTYDIGRLIQLLPVDIRLPLDVSTQELLANYAVAARYPGDDEPISMAEARRALSVMRKVRKVVRSILPDVVLRKTKRL